MKKLVVSLKDIQGVPHGSQFSRTNVRVIARYTSEIVLTDGTIVPNVVVDEPVSAPGGSVTFDVWASDDPAVKAEYRDFAIRVDVQVSPSRGTSRKGTWTHTAKVLQSSSSPVQFGSLPFAEGLPPKFASIQDFAEGFVDAAVDAAVPPAVEAEIAEQAAPKIHATRHAAGGSDPITATSIDALPTRSTPIGSGADLNTLLDGGNYYQSTTTGSTLAKNYPISGFAGHIRVLKQDAAGSVNRIQEATYYDGRDLFKRGTWTRSYNSGVWSAWLNLAGGPREANGSPEGVYAAPVGSEYADTDGTNGARKWIKTSGTGATGWAVTYGDTGTRDLRALVKAPFAQPAALLIRRMGRDVELILDDMVIPETSPFLDLPAGFRPPVSSLRLAIPSNVSGTANIGTLQVSGVVRFYGIGTLRTIVRWSTKDAWPTTLPGVAA